MEVSTMKRIDDGKPIQHFTPRRKGSNWCRHNIERCRRLIEIGEMTPAGLAVMPDPDSNRPEEAERVLKKFIYDPREKLFL